MKSCFIASLGDSGTISKMTGAFTVYDSTNKFYCFSCHEKGDTFDLIRLVEDIEFGKPLFDRAAAIFGVSNDGSDSIPTTGPVKKKTDGSEGKPMTEEQLAKHNAFIEKCKIETSNHDYYYSRGLSTETISKYNLGISRNYYYYSKNGKRTPDLGLAAIIPYPSIPYYIVRLLNKPENVKGWDNYVKMTGKPEPLFNADALYQGEHTSVFIVEGQLDALSIVDLGGSAVGLGSAGNYTKLIKCLERKPTDKTLIISLDNDSTGQGFTDSIVEGLKKLNVPHIVANVSGEYKDPNEALINDRDAFAKAVQDAQRQASIHADVTEDKEQENIADYISDNQAQSYLPNFLADIEAGNGEMPIKTQFKLLDGKLGGGLYAGLYVIGAVPSIGKTTFVLQMADNIAKVGKQDVLYFSLEMAKRELIAKSVSREYGKIADSEMLEQRRLNTREILSCTFDPKIKPAVIRAFNNYSEYANHIYVSEGIGSISTKEILTTVKQHIAATGHKPVVVIDYLQLLAPSNNKQTDKQNMDSSIMDLKRISRDLGIPVVAVSSFGRASYTTDANMGSVKESGGIEYSCDCLIALQYQNMTSSKTEEKMGVIKNAMASSEKREIELQILKNRNGVGAARINYTFDTIMSQFIESPIANDTPFK